MPHEVLAPLTETPKKLENFLKNRFPIGYVRKLFRKNGIRLNGKRPKPADIVCPGDRIQLYIPFEENKQNLAGRAISEQKIKVIFEDQDLLVVDKPAGIAVHEGKEILKRHSVIGILQAKYHGAGVLLRLVHRLDKDTSGILLIAKQDKLAQELENQFIEGKVAKEYLCLVVGRVPQNEGKIDSPLPGRTGRAVCAITQYEVTRRFANTTLLRVRIATGRMHQIRLHLAKLGHPVVLDNRHGDFAFNRRFRKDFNLERQFLHASSLTLRYHGKHCTWRSLLPLDLARASQSLAENENRSLTHASSLRI